jgi:hypothetical protein
VTKSPTVTIAIPHEHCCILIKRYLQGGVARGLEVAPERTILFPCGLSKRTGADYQRATFEDERPTQDDVAEQKRVGLSRPSSYLRDALVDRKDSAGDKEAGSDEQRPEETVLAVAVGVFPIRAALREGQAYEQEDLVDRVSYLMSPLRQHGETPRDEPGDKL